MSIQKKIENGREYRSMQIGEVEGIDFTVEGYATTYEQPYTLYSYKDGDYNVTVDEQVDRHAFDEADMSDVIMQYDHEGRVFARLSNNTLSLDKDDENGLLIRANLGGTEIGRQLYEEIKGGYTSKMSFGFTVAEDTVEESAEGKNIRYLRTIKRIGKLYDVSAVSLPANDYTTISARNALNGEIEARLTERSARERREAKRQELLSKVKGL